MAAAASFVRLEPTPTPRIAASSEAYPGGNHGVDRLIDGKAATEYSSDSHGVRTFVEFDFGAPTTLAAFRHHDRSDPATIAVSELVFLDARGGTIAAHTVQHVNRPAGVTFLTLPEPVTAQKVRWRVTRLGSSYSTVGGAEVAFFRPGATEDLPRSIRVVGEAQPILARQGSSLTQPLKLVLDYPYAQPADAIVSVPGQGGQAVRLTPGQHTLTFTLPAVESVQSLEIGVEVGGQRAATEVIRVKPARKTTIYITPHSHTDIGYTEIQTEIEDKQVNNLLLGMEYARKTAHYPPGARFVWNVEVLWAADLFLERLGEAPRRAFLEAVRNGQVALCGMYLNELTGLCRPEELLRLFRFATQLRDKTGARIDTAMISDVPGYTWGTVTAMAQAGIKYFSVAPNYFDRIGDILVQWENKPFYWVGPSGKEKVLVWIPYRGYAMSHVFRALSPEFVAHYQSQLDKSGYPYDIACMRWAGHGDNAAPDAAICEFVKEWSSRYEWPRFIISSASEAFQALEARYADKIPEVRGDWTPYWEDGAGSSALETAQNRASSDRLIQAEALWAIQRPRTYPAKEFEAAWRKVLLYSEHTWGAWCSIGEPARRETREQWAIKQSYAVGADLHSRELLSQALGQQQTSADEHRFDVFNTTSWARTDLVTVPKYLSEGRHRVVNEHGQPLPSQRLRNGELVFLARDVAPLASQRYRLEEGQAHSEKPVLTQGASLDNGIIFVRVDESTGGIMELRLHGLDHNFADTSAGQALNEYLYLPGDELSQLQRNGTVKIRVKEAGPLIASLMIESEAPGCHRLQREVRLVAGRDYVEIDNLVDKQRLVAASYHANNGKESVNFGFPFHVPGGQVRLEVPYGLIRPDADQIPSACKNWFTIGRWAEVANDELGVTWVSLDAPLVQVGELSARLLNSQTNPDVWRKQVGPTQKLYSWAMNNHWGTNYRAYQEGPTLFRFILRPHRRSDPASASRLAIGLGQPLLATGSRREAASMTSRMTLSSEDVLVTGIKPSDDGRAVIVRLWGAAGRDASTQIRWSKPAPRQVWLSDLSEKPLRKLRGSIPVPAWGVVTLRAEL